VLAGRNYQNVKYIGCILQVNVYWKCDLDDDGKKFFHEKLTYLQKNVEFIMELKGWIMKWDMLRNA